MLVIVSHNVSRFLKLTAESPLSKIQPTNRVTAKLDSQFLVDDPAD